MLYMRCRCEQLLSASRKRLEAATRVCAFVARILSTFAEHQHLEEVARDNSLRHGDGRWRGHHYSVDPSERRTEQTFGSTGPSRAKLERAGWNFQHFSEEIRFENDDSVLPAMAGIIAKRAESAEAAFKRPGQFHRRL